MRFWMFTRITWRRTWRK